MRLFRSAAALALTLAAGFSHAQVDSEASHSLPYVAVFRTIDTPPIEAGQSINGWNGWRVPRGEARVMPFAGPNETPAVRLEPGTTVRRPIAASGVPEVWTAVFVRSAGGSTSFADLPTRPLGAVIIFDAAAGLVAIDGDGLGGGTPVTLGFALDGETIYDLAIRHDYADQHYDVYINGVAAQLRLGFRDNVPEFSGFLQGAQSSSCDMSDVWISTEPPPNVDYKRGDVNIDSDVDAADLVLLLNHLNGETGLGTQPRINADLDENDILTAADLDLLIDMLIGQETTP